MVLGGKAQDARIEFRVTDQFKRDLEKAALKDGASSLAEFIKRALIEKAERVGVKIRR